MAVKRQGFMKSGFMMKVPFPIPTNKFPCKPSFFLVLYLSNQSFVAIGFPELGNKSPAQLTETIQHGIFTNT